MLNFIKYTNKICSISVLEIKQLNGVFHLVDAMQVIVKLSQTADFGAKQTDVEIEGDIHCVTVAIANRRY